MIRSFILALALIGQTCSAAQSKPRPTYKDFSSGWSIRVLGEDSDYCAALRIYNNGETLMVGYLPAYNRASVSITSRASSSLEEGETVNVNVSFLSGRTLDQDWGAAPFETYKQSDGTSQMIGHFNGREMLRDIARNELIAFSVDEELDRLIGSYKLDGSAVAMDALRRCSFEAAGLDINDPFLR